jgi:hypothetical protein
MKIKIVTQALVFLMTSACAASALAAFPQTKIQNGRTCLLEEKIKDEKGSMSNNGLLEVRQFELIGEKYTHRDYTLPNPNYTLPTGDTLAVLRTGAVKEGLLKAYPTRQETHLLDFNGNMVTDPAQYDKVTQAVYSHVFAEKLVDSPTGITIDTTMVIKMYQFVGEWEIYKAEVEYKSSRSDLDFAKTHQIYIYECY